MAGWEIAILSVPTVAVARRIRPPVQIVPVGHGVGDLVALVVLDIGSVVVAVIIWNLPRMTWMRMQRVVPFFGFPALVAGVPAFVAISWATLGITGRIADLVVGNQSTGFDRTIWFLLSVAPLIAAFLLAAIQRPLWMQPPGRTNMIDPRAVGERSWAVAVPVFGAMSIVGTGAFAIGSHEWFLVASSTASLIIGLPAYWLAHRFSDRGIRSLTPQVALEYQDAPVEVPSDWHPVLFGLWAVFFGFCAITSAAAAVDARNLTTGLFGIGCAAFAGLFGVSLRHHRGWVLTQEGFIWSGPAGSAFYAWGDVTNFRVVGGTGFVQSSVGFDFVAGREPQGLKRALTTTTRAMLGVDRALPNDTILETDDLVSALRRWRAATLRAG